MQTDQHQPSPTTAAPPALDIRPVRDAEEFRACQEIQRRAWGITEDGYLVPVATMAGAQRVGGLVLGAFDRRRMVGFSFAFLGRLHGELVLYSQLSGVDPDRQNEGIGRLIKEEQRRWAAEQGLPVVAWAYDPLQAGNANFNLAVLGATSRTYEVDLYGSRTDALNAGLETDRLIVEWPTSGEPSGLRKRWPDGVELIVSEPRADGLRRPARVHQPDGAPRLHVEIPTSIRAVLRANAELARDWQLAVRRALGGALESGYVAVGFARGERPCYLLERAT